jgi:hypothetical protein
MSHPDYKLIVVIIRGEIIEDVESFTCLGSVVTKDEGAAQNVSQQILKTNFAFVPKKEINIIECEKFFDQATLTLYAPN